MHMYNREHHNSYLYFESKISLAAGGSQRHNKIPIAPKIKRKISLWSACSDFNYTLRIMIIHVLMCCLSIKMNLIIAINVDNKNCFLDDRVGISLIGRSFGKKKKKSKCVSKWNFNKFLVLNSFKFFVCLMRMRNIRKIFYNLILK